MVLMKIGRPEKDSLHTASEVGKADVVKRLPDEGSESNGRIKQITRLHVAWQRPR